MLTKDENIFNLAKKSFTAWADALDPATQGALWTKPTWENVSKGTRKRFVREAKASIAAQATQEPQQAPEIIETPTAPIEAIQAPEQAAEAV